MSVGTAVVIFSELFVLYTVELVSIPLVCVPCVGDVAFNRFPVTVGIPLFCVPVVLLIVDVVALN